MHPFSELAMRCAAFTHGTLSETREHILQELQGSGATVLVKALQSIELQQAIVAVGMVAMFEAALQDALECEDGFGEALRMIEGAGDDDLARQFRDVQLAINVLKHGRGRSYEALLHRREDLPFRIKAHDESFEEGDVSELAFLIKADEGFLAHCASIVDRVAAVIRGQKEHAFV